MPDFSARIVSGATLAIVEDDGDPPRIYEQPGLPARYWKLTELSATDIVLGCTVDGVDRPADAALGGRLFSWWWVTWPGYPAAWSGSGGLPHIVPTAATSSEATIVGGPDGDAAWLGHWTIGVRRETGGAVLFGFDVEAAPV